MGDESLLAISEQFESILLLAQGYKIKATEAGFSAQAAEEMAVQLHGQLVVAAFRGKGKR